MNALSTSTRGILNPRAGEASFVLERFAPSGDLAFFVERYWIVRWDLRGRPPYEQEVVTHPNVNLVFESERAAVHGVGTRRFVRQLTGAGHVVAVKFRPGGFYPFFQRPVAELTDRSIPLRDLFGVDDEGLRRDVLASEPHDALDIVEDFLRALRPQRDPNVTKVARIVDLALERRAITTVEQLAAAGRVSVRTLQRLFERYVGVSPKWVIRRFRVHEAAERAEAGERVDWASFAHDLGYFDQAHFIRDFKAQVGRSPAEYAAVCAGRRR